jgi:hypothetical protein
LPTTTLVALPHLPGLSSTEVAVHGPNVLPNNTPTGLLVKLQEVATEPMFLLLQVACGMYVALGEVAEAFTLGAALGVVAYARYAATPAKPSPSIPSIRSSWPPSPPPTLGPLRRPPYGASTRWPALHP